MKDISLKDLLEAGCHFGHKVSKWHPKAKEYIYQAREGVHIIDLAKTRDELKKAGEFFYQFGQDGRIMLLVASKRQAKGVVTEAAKRAELPYLTNRWIGGFVTNWDEVKKNIEKMNKARKEKTDGSWNQFPKHEIVKLTKDLRKKELVYSGVAELSIVPNAIFIVDINKEISAIREAIRRNIPVVALVDTNVDPTPVDYPIPANDDAVGSIQFIVNYLVDCYIEGKRMRQKEGEKQLKKEKKEEEIKKVGIVKDEVEVEKVEKKEEKVEEAARPETVNKSEESEKKKEKEEVKKKGKTVRKKTERKEKVKMVKKSIKVELKTKKI